MIISYHKEKKYSYGKTFLYLGRLIYEKGLIELTEAFDHLIKKHNDAKLIICGSYDSSDPRCIEKERIGIGESLETYF